MTGYTSAALELFEARAIDPAVAAACEVQETDGQLLYPTGKRRSLNGKKHLQPTGQEIRPWWVTPRNGSSVLVTEGETDGLAAASSLAGPFDGLPVLALPACTYPPHKLVQGLQHYGIKDAYLCLDADEAGRKALKRFCEALRHAGIRPIPVELPEGYDLAAWLAEGGDLANLLADSEAADETRRRGRSFAEIEPGSVSWLWQGWVPFGHITVLGGDPKVGKSSISQKFAARASRDGHAVLGAWTEDDADVVAKRLAEYDANLSLIHELLEDEVQLPGDLARLREQIELNDARFVILDHFDAFLADDINPTRKNEARRALRPLRALASELDVAVLILCHLNRYTEGPKAYKIPVGLAGSARSLLMLEREDDGVKLEHLDGNYAGRQGSILYEAEGGTLQRKRPVSKETQDGDTLVWSYDDD